MSVGKFMTKLPVSVSSVDTLYTVKELFERYKFHHVLVVDDDELIGVISDRDLLKALSTDDACNFDILDKNVFEIMSKSAITIQAHHSLYDAVKLFNKHHVSCLPVLNDKLEPVGILTWRDMLRIVENQENKRRESNG